MFREQHGLFFCMAIVVLFATKPLSCSGVSSVQTPTFGHATRAQRACQSVTSATLEQISPLPWAELRREGVSQDESEGRQSSGQRSFDQCKSTAKNSAGRTLYERFDLKLRKRGSSSERRTDASKQQAASSSMQRSERSERQTDGRRDSGESNESRKNGPLEPSRSCSSEDCVICMDEMPGESCQKMNCCQTPCHPT